MLFNIENAKAESRRFTRQGGERDQDFQIKYRSRKEKGHDITFSNAIFTTLGLESNGLAIIPLPDNDGNTVAMGFAVVPDDHASAKLFKAGKGEKKAKKINNGLLETYLAEVGVIDTSEAAKTKGQKLVLVAYDDKISIDEDGQLSIDKNGFTLYVVEAAEEASEEEEEEIEE